MRSRLKNITNVGIREYLKFYQYDTINFKEENEISAYLRNINEDSFENNSTSQSINLCSNLNVYCDEKEMENTISFNQLVYDLEVFSSIPPEIYESISPNNFIGFIIKFISISEEYGWKIVFAKENKLLKDTRFGEEFFLSSISQKENFEYEKVLVINTGNNLEIDKYILKYEKYKRIEQRYFLNLFREYIMKEICAFFKKELEQRHVFFQTVNWLWGLNNCIYPIENPTTEMINERKKYFLNNLGDKIDENRGFLKQIYEERYDELDFEQLFDIPERIEVEKGRLQHIDFSNKYIHVLNGQRKTSEVPEEYGNTIYLLGGCVFFGYAEEDKYTLASYLQRRLNKEKKTWRVVNLATWGGNIDQEYRALYEIEFKPGDIVLTSYAGLMPLEEDYKTWDVSVALKNEKMNSGTYFNGIVHCNKIGYELTANVIFNMINDRLKEYKNKKTFFLQDTYNLDTINKLQLEEYFSNN